MKRFFSLFLFSAFVFILLLFSACSGQDETAKFTVKESLESNYESLTQQLKDTDQFQQVSDYLSQWAKENAIDVKTRNDQYIVLSKAASSGYEDAETFGLHCSISFDSENEKKESLQNTATAMTALYSAEHHGTIQAIFTLHAKGEATGASSLSSQYLKSDNFIDLDYQQDTELFNSVAASSDVIASQELHMASPQYTKAYKITLEGTPYKSPYQYGSDYPNAIKTIGDLLASCQSSSVLFELASFTGGESSDLYPKSATAVIVLQENDVESFNRRFENSYEHVAEYYEDLDEPFKYTLEETKLPKRVISGSDTGNIVSLMYTITNGTYHKSDSGEIMAASNIGRISTKNKQFRMEINARSLENNLMNEMHSVFETTCGLCDIKYKEVQSTPLWYASEKLPLIEALSDGFGTSVSGTLENKEAQIFLEKNPDLNLVIWGVNLKNAEKKLSVLLTYMESFGVVENK